MFYIRKIDFRFCLSYSEHQFDDLNLYPWGKRRFSSGSFAIRACNFVYLSSILLHLGVGLNVKPHKKILVWYLDNVLLDKFNIFHLTICVLMFSSSSFVLALTLFFISFTFVVLFFLYNFCNFLLFSIDSTTIMVMFIITHLY